MKALRFNQTGDFNFLQYVDFPMPILGVDEVLIEVKAARLNRNDLSNVMGRLPYTTLPRTPGRDYAGIIVDGPLELIGHDVWGTGKENGFVRDGSHAQFFIVHQNDIAIKPKTLSYIQAANCGTPYITAWFGMQSCQVQKSTKIAIIGAAGAVEAIFTILALRDQIAPPTINLDDPMDEVEIDLVPNKAKECKMEYAMTNSFGFGGTNASLVLKKL